MTEELLVRHCSPTLAGLKTANMFSCTYNSLALLRQQVEGWHRRLSVKGLAVLLLSAEEGNALIYVYRPSFLQQDLACTQAEVLLAQCGYSGKHPGICLRRLMGRLQCRGEFPHEIGLFLGYPPEDVQGFMENHAQHPKCTGCWKVYGDALKAKLLFRLYKTCTQQYWQQWQAGKRIEQLAMRI